MPTTSDRAAQLHDWIERLRAGDLTARDELLRVVWGQIAHLAGKMHQRFPGVRRLADADDVLQNAMLRLLHALPQARPDSVQAFYGFATAEIRRELLDLVRRVHGRSGVRANLVPRRLSAPGDDACDPPAPFDDPHELDEWSAFQEEVERLPAEEREVFCLVFYHGWKQSEAAALFQVTVRTVQRRWESAVAQLRRRLKEDT